MKRVLASSVYRPAATARPIRLNEWVPLNHQEFSNQLDRTVTLYERVIDEEILVTTRDALPGAAINVSLYMILQAIFSSEQSGDLPLLEQYANSSVYEALRNVAPLKQLPMSRAVVEDHESCAADRICHSR